MEGTPKDQVITSDTSQRLASGIMAGSNGRTIIITGATGSMGVVATREKAREGWTVIMACRNQKKAEKAKEKIIADVPNADLIIMPLDLSSQQSVRDFVDGLDDRQIDALFCNAGYMARQYELSVDGFEMDMATNYLGNKLLCELLIPRMRVGAHIVNMVSLTAKYAHWDENWQQMPKNKFSQLGTYATSKRALLIFTAKLSKKYPKLHINVADPGIVDSNMISMGRWFDPLADIFFRPFIKSPEKGVYPALQALHSDVTGKYFVGHKVKEITNY